MKVNFTGQLFDILANRTPENITNLRFIPSDKNNTLYHVK